MSSATLEEILKQKPSLSELCRYVRIGPTWYLFGTQLDLDPVKLDGIQVSNNDVDYKTMKMFQLWLDTDSRATRQKVVDTLRLEVIGKNRVAKDYEEALVTLDPSSLANTGQVSSVRGQRMLTFKDELRRITINWKQGSVLGFGGDRTQHYTLCEYNNSEGKSVPVYIQNGYNIPQNLTVDSSLQYGMQEGVLFYVLHDKSQKPYQHRFRTSDLQNFGYAVNAGLKAALGIDLASVVGDYLHDI